ncbi:hypothetical protein THASP1DRAFT_24439 [Thamnocephalis sphaerospora]|uniref:F-box domain-containing protein n=1 Tax=Thamnocephalis sphaerospora TaxID=78915 RepID=A0A4P9XN98_9FUNG|nr:hypothetical protein THASP1DRAFT_24439 [Thamnocephalis sphaerospora]|eukprot:RKP07408.1 hypothetical protein THASP1DRAFT_24439 [Thamnocephalis sphaerospora]
MFVLLPEVLVWCIGLWTDDDAALVLLAATCRRLRQVVAADQKLWRVRFQRRFPLHDDYELRWFRMHFQVRRIASGHLRHSLQLPGLPAERLPRWFDWFDAFCHRLATQFRWRRADYAAYLPAPVKAGQPPGTRLQSIGGLHDFRKRSVVVSQRVIDPSQRPKWQTERPRWHGINRRRYDVDDVQMSANYLLVTLSPKGKRIVDKMLCVWHLDALSKPPHCVSSNFCGRVAVFDGWLLLKNQLPAPMAPLHNVRLYDLARRHFCPGGLECLVGDTHIQRLGPSRIDLLHTKVETSGDHARIVWRQWDFPTMDTAAIRCLSHSSIDMPGGLPQYFSTRRVDDHRALLARNSTGLSMRRIHRDLCTLAMLTADATEYGEASASMGITWKITVLFENLRCIVAQNIICLQTQHFIVLLRLSTGVRLTDIPIISLGKWFSPKTSRLFTILQRPFIFPGFIYDFFDKERLRVVDLMQVERRWHAHNTRMQISALLKYSPNAALVAHDETLMILDFSRY